MARYEIVCVHKPEGREGCEGIQSISILSSEGSRRLMGVGEAAARALMGSDEFFVKSASGEEVEARVAPGAAGGSSHLKSQPDGLGVDWLLRAPRCR